MWPAPKGIHWMGHVNPDKVRVISQWDTPKSPAELRSFLGLSNFFKKFIAGYAAIITPMTRLLALDDFVFDNDAKQAFEHLKLALTHAPVLAIPDDSKPYTLVTDASGFGCGGVLLQDGRPVSFWRYKMLPAERNYSVGEQEQLAVVRAFLHWRHCLEGALNTVVITDHKLVTFNTRSPDALNRQCNVDGQKYSLASTSNGNG